MVSSVKLAPMRVVHRFIGRLPIFQKRGKRRAKACIVRSGGLTKILSTAKLQSCRCFGIQRHAARRQRFRMRVFSTAIRTRSHGDLASICTHMRCSCARADLAFRRAYGPKSGAMPENEPLPFQSLSNARDTDPAHRIDERHLYSRLAHTVPTHDFPFIAVRLNPRKPVNWL